MFCLVLGQAWGVESAFGSSSVNTQSGVYSYDHVDASAVVGRSRVAFLRTYNNTDYRQTPLGPGWTHNFDMRINRPAADSLDIIVVGSQGRSDTFRWNPDGSGTYLARPELPVLSLVQRSTGEYVASEEDGSVWTFDAQGRLTEVAQPNKPTLTVVQGVYGATAVLGADRTPVFLFDYDEQTHRLVSVTDVPDPALAPISPRVVRFSYDLLGRLSAAADRNGQVTHYTYDGSGYHLTSIVDARGHAAIRLTYDAQERVVSRMDARGLLTQHSATMQYMTMPDGTQVTLETKVPSGLEPAFGPTITSVYDANQRLISLTTKPAPANDPEVQTWTWGSDPMRAFGARSGGGTPPSQGVPVLVTSGEPGAATDTVGDPADPLPTPGCIPAPPPGSTPRSTLPWTLGTETMDPRQAAQLAFGLAVVKTVTPTLDGFHRPVSFGDLNTGMWSIDYDGEDRPTHLQTPTGDVTEIRYDEVGNTSDIIEPGGRISHFAYDERDSVVRAQWPSGHVSLYAYDERGDLSRAELDPARAGDVKVADYAHDGLRRIRRVTRYTHWPSADAEVTEFGYTDTGGCMAYRSLQSNP